MCPLWNLVAIYYIAAYLMLHEIFIIIWSFDASSESKSLPRVTRQFSNNLSMAFFPIQRNRIDVELFLYFAMSICTSRRKENLNLSIDIVQRSNSICRPSKDATYTRCSEHIALRPAFPLFVQTNRNPAFLFLATERVLSLKGSHSAINTCRQTIHFTSFPFIMKIAQNACAACVTRIAVKRMELGRRWRRAKRLTENEDPMRHQPPTK